MNETQLEQNISDAIAPVIEETGHRLVCVEMGQDANMPILRVMCENPKTKRINIDECATISREISPILDVESFIDYNYRLEVSSPGIDRPLTNADDFRAHAGHEARIWLSIPLDTGQKKMRGAIESVTKTHVILKSDKDIFQVEHNNIAKAKLILTDKLLKDTAKSFDVSDKSE